MPGMLLALALSRSLLTAPKCVETPTVESTARTQDGAEPLLLEVLRGPPPWADAPPPTFRPTRPLEHRWPSGLPREARLGPFDVISQGGGHPQALIRGWLRDLDGGGREAGLPATRRSALQNALVWLSEQQGPELRWTRGQSVDDSADGDGLGLRVVLAFLAGRRFGPGTDRAAREMFARQDRTTGTFRDESGQPLELLDQALWTLAMEEWHLQSRSRGTSSVERVRRACRALAARRSADGSWRADPEADLPRAEDEVITCVVLEALLVLRDTGWGVPPEHVAPGLRWLRARPLDTGRAVEVRAASIWVQMLAGIPRSDARLAAEIDALLPAVDAANLESAGFFFWKYAPAVLHQLGGEPWARYQRRAIPHLGYTQLPDGRYPVGLGPPGRDSEIEVTAARCLGLAAPDRVVVFFR